MKHIILTALLWMAGCTQTIIQRPDGSILKINTLLMTSGLESLYYDPDGHFEVGKYKGVPSDVKFKYNPITGMMEVVTEKGN
jgi:hypothetical protein